MKYYIVSGDLELGWINKGGGGDLDQYYQDISSQDITKLYQKFESDFVMFGYNIEDYLHNQ